MNQQAEFPDCRPLGDNLYRRVLNQFPGRIENPPDDYCVNELNEYFFSENGTDSDDRVRGFKFKFPSQSNLFPEIADRLRQKSNDINLVILTRKNLLRRAISVLNLEWVQSRTSQANVKFDSAIEPVEYDIQELIRLMDYYRQIDDEFHRWCRQYPHTHLVDYHELTTEQERTCASLQKFLGVQRTDLRSRTKKITPVDLTKQVLNFVELRQELKNHDYHHFLEH